MLKLNEMKAAHELLSKKLQETNESHLLDKARLEENMKALSQKEANLKLQLKDQVDELKKAQEDIENKLKGKWAAAGEDAT